MNASLTKDFSAEEIRKDAFAVKGGSTPGEDGMFGFSIKASGTLSVIK